MLVVRPDRRIRSADFQVCCIASRDCGTNPRDVRRGGTSGIRPVGRFGNRRYSRLVPRLRDALRPQEMRARCRTCRPTPNRHSAGKPPTTLGCTGNDWAQPEASPERRRFPPERVASRTDIGMNFRVTLPSTRSGAVPGCARNYSSPQFLRARFRTDCARGRALAAPSARTWWT